MGHHVKMDLDLSGSGLAQLGRGGETVGNTVGYITFDEFLFQLKNDQPVKRSSPPHSYVVGYLRWDTGSNSQP